MFCWPLIVFTFYLFIYSWLLDSWLFYYIKVGSLNILHYCYILFLCSCSNLGLMGQQSDDKFWLLVELAKTCHYCNHQIPILPGKRGYVWTWWMLWGSVYWLIHTTVMVIFFIMWVALLIYLWRDLILSMMHTWGLFGTGSSQKCLD